jgi:hypothetical protein
MAEGRIRAVGPLAETLEARVLGEVCGARVSVVDVGGRRHALGLGGEEG